MKLKYSTICQHALTTKCVGCLRPDCDCVCHYAFGALGRYRVAKPYSFKPLDLNDPKYPPNFTPATRARLEAKDRAFVRSYAKTRPGFYDAAMAGKSAISQELAAHLR